MSINSDLLASSISDLVQRLLTLTQNLLYLFFLIQDDISIWQEAAHTRESWIRELKHIVDFTEVTFP